MDRRKVFSYFNGASTVFADPLVIHRRLTRSLGGNPNEVCSRADLGIAGPREDYPTEEDYQAAIEQEIASEPMRFDASEQLMDAVREVFVMAPFDTATGEGATELDCRNALAAFVTFLTDQKKTAVNSPTCSPPTENPPQ